MISPRPTGITSKSTIEVILDEVVLNNRLIPGRKLSGDVEDSPGMDDDDDDVDFVSVNEKVADTDDIFELGVDGHACKGVGCTT